jgi:CheY-like chemotaxis protein
MLKVLLVDDDDGFRETLNDWLESKKYQVTIAKDGFEGLKALANEIPDVLITDIVMPNKDGIELLFDINKKYKGFPCKVIAMSGGGRVIDQQMTENMLEIAQDIGVDIIIKKPFKLALLEEHLKAILS